MTNILQQHQSDIQQICKEEGISYLALFGSHARGDERPESDVDLLARFYEPKDLIELNDTETRFKKLLGRNVDLVTITGLSKFIKPYIQDDLTVLYEEKP